MDKKIIKIQKYFKLKNYLKVSLDGGEILLVDAETAAVFHLKENLTLNEETIKKIISRRNYNRLKNYTMFLLSKKSYSRKSLFDKLTLKGYEKENIEKVLDLFNELNVINDEHFAKNLTRTLQSKGKGNIYIKNELKKHKISSERITEILNDPEDEMEEYERAIRIIKKKYPKFDNNDKNIQRKVAMFLQRRGFSFEDINKAFRNFNDN